MTLESQLTFLPSSPYKGLNPYSEEDAAIFFGRERSSNIIYYNFCSWRLTVLYGPSGVGKSSLLRAGVAAKLYREAREKFNKLGISKAAVVVFNYWQDDYPLFSLQEQIEADIRKINLNIQSPDPGFSFVNALKFWTDHLGAEEESGELFIILDQFEEYFLYHSLEIGESTFAGEFPRAVNCPDLPVHFLISIREDALAKLDYFKEMIPGIFDHCLRIKHLDQKSACDAIKKPIEECNRHLAMNEQPFEIEDSLISAILREVQIGRIIPIESGELKKLPEAEIEAPYLQLTMTRLWEEELKKGSHCLRLVTLNQLGGTKEIITGHLNKQMDCLSTVEKDIAAHIFEFLVTPSGTRLAYSSQDLADITGVDEAELIALLERLSSGQQRIVRPVPPLSNQPPEATRYEVFHDVLALAIRDWRRKFLQFKQNQSWKEPAKRKNIQRKVEEQAKTIQRLRILLVMLIILSLALLILLVT